MDIEVYTDGSGDGRYGYVIEYDGRKVVDITESKDITNNEAEYWAVIEALKRLDTLRILDVDNHIVIKSDSQVVVRQLNGEYHIKKNSLRELAMMVFDLSEGMLIDFDWVSRKENKAGKLLG